ncbi:azurin [Salinisphaera sp. PC39]|uniref:azurin n=1 Tax=Salinisphaera sp. PC39 TaxID=1304156 RepID=UPI003340C405
MRKLKATFALIALGSLFAAGPAAAGDCELSITGNDQIQYNKSELVVPAGCDKVTLTLEHVGKMSVQQMGHNWVLTESADYQAVAQAGMQAGADNAYVPPEDDRVIVHTDLVGGGESTSITFDVSQLEAGGDYTYFCSFPGHFSMMKGKLIVK